MKLKQWIAPLAAVLLMAAVLLGASTALRGVAEANAKAELESMIAFMLPESSTFTEEVYDGEDPAITAVYKGETGYVIQTSTTGYAGEVVLLVGVDNDGEVTGLMVRQLSETWGLGAEALRDSDFLIQFLGTEGDAEIGENVDAITGATVTSKAIARSVNAAVGFVTGADTSSGATSWGG